MPEQPKGLLRKAIDWVNAKIDWANANAFHHKGHGTHQEHLDEMHRILEERRRQPDYRDPDKDYGWVPILAVAGIAAVLIVVFALVG